MAGQLKIISNKEIFFSKILVLIDEREEFGSLKYTYGICECYDIGENDPIDYIEIDNLQVDRGVEYSTEVSITCRYYDHNLNCTVIEFG